MAHQIDKPETEGEYLHTQSGDPTAQRFWQLQDGRQQPLIRPTNLEGLNSLTVRLLVAGGPSQQSRMIRDKRRSLDRAVLYSYQGAFIKHLEQNNQYRALINPDKLKQDYDDKILSVGFEAGFQPGDVFEWVGTNTYWLIYLQDLNERAYFRGEIRRCSYEVSWLDDDGNTQHTYVALRGPVETKIDYIQKHGISVDNPNHSIHFLMPLTEETKKYFRRYSKFYLQDDPTCWRVEAWDWLSTPNILEVNAVEYFANESEDDVEAGIAGGLTLQKIQTIEENNSAAIEGETFIKPKKEYTYTYTQDAVGTWQLDSNLPIKSVVNGRELKLQWVANYSGSFKIKYGNCEKTIVVESLF